MHGKSRLPNFDLKEWKSIEQDKIICHAYDSDAQCLQSAGEYKMFVNVRSGCLGIKLIYLDDRIICLFWEKKIVDSGKEKKLFYAAYRTENQWAIRRVKELMPQKIYIKKDDDVVIVTVHLILITGKEEIFSIKLGP